MEIPIDQKCGIGAQETLVTNLGQLRKFPRRGAVPQMDLKRSTRSGDHRR